MRYKFKFKTRSKNSGSIFYETNEIEIQTPAFHVSSNHLISGRYQSGVNGPRTAFATIIIRNKSSSSDLTRRKELKKHFVGNNAGQRARAWMNMMLNNIPDYVDEYR